MYEGKSRKVKNNLRHFWHVKPHKGLADTLWPCRAIHIGCVGPSRRFWENMVTWWVVGWKFHMGLRIDNGGDDDDDEDEDDGRMSDVCQKRNWLVSRWWHSIKKQSFKTKNEILQVGHMVSSNSPSQHSCRIYVFLLDIIFLTSCSRHGLRLASSVQAASCWWPVVI